MPPHASLFVTVGIPAHALLVWALFVFLHARAGRAPGVTPAARTRATRLAALGATLWLGATAAVALSGLLAHWDVRPPPLLPFMAVNVGVALALGLSPAGARLARGVPLALLIGAQAFRLPLELVMHEAARESVMPPQMTFTGLNFDVVTGALALPLALLVARGTAPRALVVAWNALGFVTLTAIAAIALAATPFVHAFGTDGRHLNTWVAYFPFVWLPAGPVVFALAGHVVVARALRTRAAPSAGESAAAA